MTRRDLVDRLAMRFAGVIERQRRVATQGDLFAFAEQSIAVAERNLAGRHDLGEQAITVRQRIALRARLGCFEGGFRQHDGCSRWAHQSPGEPARAGWWAHWWARCWCNPLHRRNT